MRATIAKVERVTVDAHECMVAFYGPEDEYAFIWHGGPYIDLVFLDSDGSVEVSGKRYCYSAHCINVWDYDDNTTTIEWEDSEAFAYEVEEWITDSFLR